MTWWSLCFAPPPLRDWIKIKSSMDPFNFFSSVILHGLASTNNVAHSIHLTRTQSFPAKRYAYDTKSPGPVGSHKDWDALSPLVGQLHADLEITEQLSEGRIGLVFAARLVSLRQSLHDEPLTIHSVPLPSQFCVKLVKPEYIRSLAREAWFYEQLAKAEGYPGAVTPVCFGFFTCPLPSEAGIQLHALSSVLIKPEPPSHTPEGEEPIYDRYYDDLDFEYVDNYLDDDRTSHCDSPWNLKQWRERADRSPIIGINVTERIGKHIQLDDFPGPTFRFPRGNCYFTKEAETEIVALLDDLSALGILQDDTKFNNILWAASESKHWLPASAQICPRHKQVHLYRLIDFDRAAKWNRENPVDHGYFCRLQLYPLKESQFWGDCM
ncbi:hypothetical protein BDP27DRAFT_1448048 [Rhodocollybia butyracea]|uniref:Uncharacterized protein n=1 Tax=Rhodocollybia butyracea TaxID=206335 RepID=A0A9P5U8J9_9AGAR|nr:hypothetical protein BDP27DRAFT_1448048 [Rhodocollybia butyracea]